MVGEANVRGTAFCCECNLCSVFACPEDLDPKDVCGRNKRRLASEGSRWTDPPFNPGRADLHLANRKAPIRHLMRRLDLLDFNNEGPLVEQAVSTSRVGIALSQHIGVPCEPVVKAGQKVSRGQLVGDVPIKDGKSALGAPVHASIDGKVVAITDGVVWIQK